MTDHVLWTIHDFSGGDPFEEPSQLEKMVCEGGLEICRFCGAGELQLDDNPTCEGHNQAMAKEKASYQNDLLDEDDNWDNVTLGDLGL